VSGSSGTPTPDGLRGDKAESTVPLNKKSGKGSAKGKVERVFHRLHHPIAEHHPSDRITFHRRRADSSPTFRWSTFRVIPSSSSRITASIKPSRRLIPFPPRTPPQLDPPTQLTTSLSHSPRSRRRVLLRTHHISRRRPSRTAKKQSIKPTSTTSTTIL
jgi:hypothetical protein